jgi:hypothetical protein
VRRMLRPKTLHGPLVAAHRALEVELIEWHLGQLLSHSAGLKSFLRKTVTFIPCNRLQEYALAIPRSSRTIPAGSELKLVRSSIN